MNENTLLHHTIKKIWGWTLINMQLLIECYLLVFDLIFLFIVETYPSNQFRCIVRFSLMIDWHASICFSLCGKGPRNFPLWTRTRGGAGMSKTLVGTQAYVVGIIYYPLCYTCIKVLLTSPYIFRRSCAYIAQCSGKPIFFPVPVFKNFCIL